MHPLNKLLAEHRRGELPQPGVYEGIDRGRYFSWPCLNASLLKHGVTSAAHFLAALQQPDEPTEALRFGTFAHAGQLEPLALLQRYVVMPDFAADLKDDYKVPKASSVYKQRVAAWMEQNQGKEAVEQAWLDGLVAMGKTLAAHERARRYLNAAGPVEVALVWDDPSGVRCKALVDKLAPADRRITDYKTTRDVQEFERQIVFLGYDIQGAFYADGAFSLTGAPHEFCLVAQEKEPPFTVRAAPVSELHLVCGRRLYRKALTNVLAAVESNIWPSLPDPDEWERPAWATPDVELEIQGELVTL